MNSSIIYTKSRFSLHLIMKVIATEDVLCACLFRKIIVVWRFGKSQTINFIGNRKFEFAEEYDG